MILPTFAQTSLRDISAAVVRLWHGDLSTTAVTQRAHAYALLRSLLATAVDDDILASNPCRIRGAGVTRRARGVEPATLRELEVLVEHMPDRYRALVLLGAW